MWVFSCFLAGLCSTPFPQTLCQTGAWSIFLRTWATPNWMIFFLSLRAHPSRPFCARWAPLSSSAGSGCTYQLSDQLIFYALKSASRPPFICASVTTAAWLFHPHTSLIIQSVSHQIHLLVSPSPLSNHLLCSEPRSQAPFFCSAALLFFLLPCLSSVFHLI